MPSEIGRALSDETVGHTPILLAVWMKGRQSSSRSGQPRANPLGGLDDGAPIPPAPHHRSVHFRRTSDDPLPQGVR
ncbi:putative protein without homology [Propionibacterium freudenreichii subsp. shermanii]|nr:putative protein without homology [Propionibacterium freudenreichii subsp. shermanii]